ncbi:kinase-like domain-containing protein [Rostrohypoxylon terebratum]|nr:kinase-like domain-containing protein [Rostrohypoxylon terebratum]
MIMKAEREPSFNMETAIRDETSTGVNANNSAEKIVYDVNYIWKELGIEDVQKYNHGGYHPVHLLDTLDNRFEVIHKLGSGGFGTVWLCRDLKLQKWRAVKIIAADRSFGTTEEKIFKHLRENFTLEELENNYINIPLEEFFIEGPNGTHRCQVMSSLGWKVSDWRLGQASYGEQAYKDIRNICHQITKALSFLHEHGICHGDYRPSNILMKLEGIDELNEDQILDLIGEPQVHWVQTVSGNPPKPRAPDYCVEPSYMNDECEWFKKLRVKSVAVIDFGESFFIQDPPKGTGIPDLWAAPEIIFRGSRTLGPPSDIWSLACTLFEVWTNTPLFYTFHSGLRQTIRKIEYFLGPLPQRYRRIYDKILRGESLDEDAQDQAEEVESEASETLDDQAAERDEFIKMTGFSDIFEAELGQKRERRRDGKVINLTYNPSEAVELADLLRNMLKYDPDERIKMDQVVSHPWVKDGRTEPTHTTHGGAVDN